MNSPMFEITWFGLLAERRGLACELLPAGDVTAGELYTRLASLHDLRVPAASVLVAVNDALVSPAQPLQPGDRVAFMPPMSGG